MGEDREKHLRSLVGRLSASQRTALFRRLRGGPQDAPSAEHEPTPAPADWAISHGQHRVWLLEQLCPGMGLTVEVEVFHVEGPLDPERFGLSLATVLERHEALRSYVPVHRGQPRYSVAPRLPAPHEHVDLTGLEPEARLERVRAWQLGEDGRGFDPRTPPLFRSCLFRVGPQEHIWCIAAHHIICDGWSIRVLLADLARSYRSPGTPRPAPVGARYSEFIAWERARLGGDHGRTLREYWARTLADAPDSVALPLDRPRPDHRRFVGHRLDHPVPHALRERCEALGRAHGASPFMVSLAAFDVLLWCLSGQQDLVVATPMANRERPDMHDVIGCFVNTLPIRVRVDGGGGFEALLDQVRTRTLEALEHQGLPYDLVVQTHGASPGGGLPTLCNVMFVHEEQLSPVHLGDRVHVRLGQERADRGRSMFDLLLWVSARSEGWVVTAEHDTDLLNEVTVADLLKRYHDTLQAVTDDPERPLVQLLAELSSNPSQALLDAGARFSFESPGGP